MKEDDILKEIDSTISRYEKRLEKISPGIEIIKDANVLKPFKDYKIVISVKNIYDIGYYKGVIRALEVIKEKLGRR